MLTPVCAQTSFMLLDYNYPESEVLSMKTKCEICNRKLTGVKANNELRKTEMTENEERDKRREREVKKPNQNQNKPSHGIGVFMPK